MPVKAYPRYVPSGVEWVGEIPDGWQELRLKFVGDAIIGLTYDPDNLTDEIAGTLVLRANNIQDRKLVADDPVFVDVDAPERLRTKAGDILICSRNGSRHLIGKNAQVTAQFIGCYFGAFNTVFRSPVNDFLFHVFNSSLFEFQSGSYLTSTINQLTLGALNSFVVPLPPVPEQQQIAAFLDWKTGQIDALIGKKKELLEKLKEKRIAVITQAVTQGLNPAAPLRDSGIPWLGNVPKHWEVKKLSRVTVSRCDGPFGSGLKSEHYVDEGVRVIRLQNIEFAEFDDEDKAFIDPEYYRELGDHDVYPGDLLVAGLGDGKNPVGRACKAPGNLGPAMVKADCFRYRFEEGKADTQFVAYQMSFTAMALSGALSSGVTRARMNLSLTSDRVLCFPPIDEQRLPLISTPKARRCA